MHIAIIGTGYVGLVSGACFAELSASVTCIDKDAAKIKLLHTGTIPFYEPGLAELVSKHDKSGRITFAPSIKKGIKDAKVVFLAVGTPTDSKTGNADLSYIFAAAEELAEHIEEGTVVVTKSTVPVHTGSKIHDIIAKKRPGLPFSVASNPEFLREGCAVDDFLTPDRIVIGVENDHARQQLEKLYKPLTTKGVPLLVTDRPTAELIKYASNAFLATKITFINEVADMCEKVGANIVDVSKGMGLDPRIGKTYLAPGPGFGGSCFPKDTLALQYMARQWGVDEQVVSSVIASNNARKDAMIDKVKKAVGGTLQGKKIAVLGVAFKANTDDIRESSALNLLDDLINEKAAIHVYDPEALKNTKSMYGKKLAYAKDAYDAMKGADVAVIVTEWAEFGTLELDKVKAALKTPAIVDFRNLYRPETMEKAGVVYSSVGRRSTKSLKASRNKARSAR